MRKWLHRGGAFVAELRTSLAVCDGVWGNTTRAFDNGAKGPTYIIRAFMKEMNTIGETGNASCLTFVQGLA